MNYDLEMSKQMSNLKEGDSLLLHACCAPCSSSVLERLGNFFNITIFYYNPNITDRFQLVINGAEIINAYSELVDPQEQEKRLLEQARLKEAGDDEAMPMDYDYIEAMEYGMPPISGWGMGIDRMVQLLTNSANIKDGILFPLMRPLNDENKDQ